MSDETRDEVLARYVHRQPDTSRFRVLEQPQPTVAVIPVDRPTCGEHSGVCVRLEHLEARDVAIAAEQRRQATEIDRLRMLPWRVVGAAVGGGGGVAGLIELLRAFFA